MLVQKYQSITLFIWIGIIFLTVPLYLVLHSYKQATDLEETIIPRNFFISLSIIYSFLILLTIISETLLTHNQIFTTQEVYLNALQFLIPLELVIITFLGIQVGRIQHFSKKLPKKIDNFSVPLDISQNDLEFYKEAISNGKSELVIDSLIKELETDTKFQEYTVTLLVMKRMLTQIKREKGLFITYESGMILESRIARSILRIIHN